MSFSAQTILRHWQMMRHMPREPRKITAGELCTLLAKEGFAVTKRTVERDLQALSALFPLITDERNKPYGWSWSKDAPVFDLPGISTSESLTILMAREHLRHIMPQSLLRNLLPLFKLAEQKLQSSIGNSAYANWQMKVRIIPATQALLPPTINPAIESVIHEAMLTNYQCQIAYQKRESKSTEEYAINLLGLIQRGGIIYLICTIKEYSDIRILVLHRLQSATLLSKKAKIPKDFNLDEYINSGAFGWKAANIKEGDNKPQEVVLLFNNASGNHLYETPLSKKQIIEPQSAGRLKVTANLVINQQLLWWILAFAENVEVIAPQSLRWLIAKKIQKTAKLYK